MLVTQIWVLHIINDVLMDVSVQGNLKNFPFLLSVHLVTFLWIIRLIHSINAD